MKDLKKSHSTAGQSSTNALRSRKHEANLQKNSTLYFQIGLILCLLATYGFFEMKFEKKEVFVPEVAFNDDFSDIVIKNYVVEPEQKVQKKVEQKSQRLTSKPPVVVKNTANIVPKDIDLVPTDINTSPVPVDNIENLKAPTKVDEPFNMINVEVVPIYPGCEKATSNEERVKCMSKKLGKLVQRKFNTDLASNLGLSGMQKIYVQFKIDELGNISDIKTRGPVRQLEAEAERVVTKIPQMTPGKQRNKPVPVLYSLPIVFDAKQ